MSDHGQGPFRGPYPDGFETVESMRNPPGRLATGRRSRFWIAWVALALLIGFFVVAVASDDPDACVGTPIGADPECDQIDP